ncbi:MoaD/ThiS family protein [Thalassotalea sp. PLHSN55]|uniref:MoaD/ThiS family protein n=1 Tax=Thalassotalea sp. PLHSN55 TaxID=3435888 RepID=UPI003F86E5CC
MIKVIFFAALREQLGCGEIELAAQDLQNIADVKAKLVQLHPNWQATFENQSLLSAVNHDMVDAQTQVTSGDEVAFFPPVTGG